VRFRSKLRKSNFADGMRVGVDGGKGASLCEIYDPPIWNLIRWWQWLMIWLWNKPRGEITMYIDGDSITVRVLYLRGPIPKVFDSE
jgi:hypothetical protein